MGIPQVPGGIYGTGQEADYYNGVPQPANFFGQPGWWYAPTSWFTKTDSRGQIFVSPNPFVAPFVPAPFTGQVSVNMIPGPPVVNVTFVSTSPHGLNLGDSVTISGATNSFFNGTFTVNNVFTATSFTYQITNLHSGVHVDNATGQGPIITPPDPSPKYACKINLDGSYVFQDLMRNLLSGNANPFLRPRP